MTGRPRPGLPRSRPRSPRGGRGLGPGPGVGPPLTGAQRGRPPRVEARLGLHGGDGGDHGAARHHRAVFLYLGGGRRALPGPRFAGFHETELRRRRSCLSVSAGTAPPTVDAHACLQSLSLSTRANPDRPRADGGPAGPTLKSGHATRNDGAKGWRSERRSTARCGVDRAPGKPRHAAGGSAWSRAGGVPVKSTDAQRETAVPPRPAPHLTPEPDRQTETKTRLSGSGWDLDTYLRGDRTQHRAARRGPAGQREALWPGRLLLKQI